MDSNTHSTPPSGAHPTGPPDGQPDWQPVGRQDDLAVLTAVVDELATQDLDGLPEVVRAERVLALRRLLDRLEGHWRKELAAVDARGAAGAELDQQPGSTAA